MGDIIDFSARPAGARPASPRTSQGPGEIVGAIGGAASASADGAHEHPVPQMGQQVRLVYPAGAELPAGMPADLGRLAVELTTLASGEASLVVTVPAADVAPVAREAMEDLTRSLGADPRDLAMAEQVRQALGQEAVGLYVATYVQRHFLQLALARTGVETYLAPDFPDADAPQEGADYKFRADVLLKPRAELSSYEPVEVGFPQKASVSSKDVSAYLEKMADQMASFEEDRTRDRAEAGDYVTISMRSTMDGAPFDALTRRSTLYQVGSGLLPDEFDRNLAEMKVRERRELSVSVPMVDDDGQPRFAVAQVRLTLEHVDRRVPANINDAWVAKNAPQAGTLLGLRGQIRDLLEQDAEASWRDELARRCATELARRLTSEPGEAYVLRMQDQLFEQYALDLTSQGIDLQTFLSQPGFDEDAFRTNLAQRAATELRQGLALGALAEHLALDVDQDALDRVLSSLAPGHERQAKGELEASGQIEQVNAMALRMQASDWLVATAKEKDGPHLQLV